MKKGFVAIAIIFFSFYAQASWAQGVISGITPGFPAETIEVRLVDSSGNIIKSTRSDMFGQFSFSNVPAGEYSIFVSGPYVQPGRSAILRVPSNGMYVGPLEPHPTTPALVAMLYAMAVSFPQQFTQVVTQGARTFEFVPNWRTCMQELSRRLGSAAFQGPSPSDSRDKAVSMAASLGLSSDFAGRLGDDMVSQTVDNFTISRHLAELASTIPSLAQGNADPYYNSELYRRYVALYNLMNVWASPELGIDISKVQVMLGRFNFFYIHDLAAMVCPN